MTRTKPLLLLAALLAGATALTACSASSGGDTGGSAKSVTIGMIGSYTGPISNFGPAFEAGFRAGLSNLTDGTNSVNGVAVKIEVRNDNATAATGLSAAKELLGDGVKMIVGPASSAVVVPVAQLVAQSKATFIAGETGTSAINGSSKYVFRSGGGSAPITAALIKAVTTEGGKSLVYVGQDYAYGQDQAKNLGAAAAAAGIKFDSVLLPTTTQDFTAGVAQVLSKHPDTIFSGWAGAGQAQLFAALTSQKAYDNSTVMALAPSRPSWEAFAGNVGSSLDKLVLITSYAESAVDTPANTAMLATLKGDKTPIDIQQPDGYFAAQLVVAALKAAGPELNPDKVSAALTGATFDAPVGAVTIRAEDHAVNVPEFAFTMVKGANGYELKMQKKFDGNDIIAPVTTSLK